MIIIDSESTPKDNEASVTQAAQPVAPAAGRAASSGASPPPYAASNSQHSCSHHHHHHHLNPLHDERRPIRRRRSPAKRFCKAFCLALFLWIFLAIITSFVVNLALGRGHHGHRNGPHEHEDDEDLPDGGDGDDGGNEKWPFPINGTTHDCTGSDRWAAFDSEDHPRWAVAYAFAAQTSFGLPLNADLLRVYSHASNIHGSVKIETSAELIDMVEVDVGVAFNAYSSLRRANVCVIENIGGESGIGIFTLQELVSGSQKDKLFFDVTIKFPVVDQHLSYVDRFETNLPFFRHDIGNTRDSVLFGSVAIKTHDAPIIVQSIDAIDASFITTDAPIFGHFKTSESLVLTTSNAAVVIEVDMLHEMGMPTELTVTTSNGHIESVLNLLSAAPSGGMYKATTTNSNGSLNITFPASPAESFLECVATTSNGPATVSLSSAFQGRFTLDTTQYWPIVSVDDLVTDPGHMGKVRKVNVNKSGSHASGDVYWGSRSGRDKGSLVVTTTNGPLFLSV